MSNSRSKVYVYIPNFVCPACEQCKRDYQKYLKDKFTFIFVKKLPKSAREEYPVLHFYSPKYKAWRYYYGWPGYKEFVERMKYHGY